MVEIPAAVKNNLLNLKLLTSLIEVTALNH